MEYTINALTKLSGVSTRTLRYYDEIGLLKPLRVASSGYRIYGKTQVDTLQQILFFRELGFSLEEIKNMLASTDFDREQAFTTHLSALQKKRKQLDTQIQTVAKTLAAMKGEITMTDQEKFEGFKQTLIADNEQKYGSEIRAKYGDAAVDESYAAVQGTTGEQYQEGERLRLEVEEVLTAALATGDPAGELAQKACELHRKWLCMYYPNYSREYHMALGEMYVCDERFREYYDRIAPGCSDFLRDAINIYCN